MPDQKPVSTIVFDVNETLLDITTLEPLFARVFGDAGRCHRIRTRRLRGRQRTM